MTNNNLVPGDGIIRDGKVIKLTPDEILRISRYQEHIYKIQDARRHINEHILRLTERDDDPWLFDASLVSEEDISKSQDPKQTAHDIKLFRQLIALDDSDLECIIERYQDNFDCNLDENSQWDNAIDNYLGTSC